MMLKKIIVLLVLVVAFLSCKKIEKTVKDINAYAFVNRDTLMFLESKTGALAKYDSFPSKYITPRPVDVWLPKDYTTDKKYSVLYMHDGQMLFDSTTTWNKQEWKVDEWATELVDQGKVKDFIVVAIHNIAQIRWQDLFPQKAFENIDKTIQKELLSAAVNATIDSKFNGDNYLKFIVEELKPMIDNAYSVYTDKNNTFVMGSSMGGLMSMYAISEYPTVFGGAACLSTHWIGSTLRDNNPFPDAIFKYMGAHLPKADTHKLYFDYGNKTLDAHYPQYASEVDEILKAKGYSDINSRHLFFEGTDHSENSWNKRLDLPLTFLLGKS